MTRTDIESPPASPHAPAEAPAPRRSVASTLLRNSWVLAIMVAIVTLATVFGGRTDDSVTEPPPAWLGASKNWLALAVLAATLVGIATEVVHRTWCALVGASLMMGLLLWVEGAPSLGKVVSWIDDSTVCLLFGMMVIVGRLADTGAFEVLGAAIVRFSGGRMWVLSTTFMLAVAFVSAWLDNVTTMLLVTPVTLTTMRRCGKDPAPLLMALAFASNLGGAATMVGDPPALIIGTALAAHIGFVDFIVNMAPGVIVATAFVVPMLTFCIFRGTLTGPIENYEEVLATAREYRITDWPLMAKSVYVTAAVFAGFLLHPVHHVDPAWFALLGAVILCVSDRPGETETALKGVEWDMLLFFAGLFVAVEAAIEVGTIDMIAGWIEAAVAASPDGARTIVAIQIVMWVAALASGFLGNIPFTIAMVPVISRMAAAGLGLDIAVLAWALNFGACFGGNLTPVGSGAGVVAVGMARKEGVEIGFGRWTGPGAVVTIVSVALADAWLLLRFCV